MKKFSVIIVLFFLINTLSCRTEVDVGSNNTLVDKTQNLNYTSSINELYNTKIVNLDCFDKSEDYQELPDDINYFCSTQKTHLTQKEYTDLKQILNKICIQKEFSKLFLPSCGWQGNNANQKSFYKVLKNTDINLVNENNFYYISAFSLTLPYNLNKNLKQSLFNAYSNPQEYLKKYKPIPNVQITPSKQPIQIFNNGYLIYYIMEIITPVITVKFDAYIKGINITKNLDLIIDKLVGIGSGVTQRNHLTFILSLPNKIVKTVSIEEKIVQDFGQHLLALKLMVQKDLQAMQIAYENYFIE